MFRQAKKSAPKENRIKDSKGSKMESQGNSTEKDKKPERKDNKPGFLKNPFSKKKNVVNDDKRDERSFQTPVQIKAKSSTKSFFSKLTKTEKTISDQPSDQPADQPANHLFITPVETKAKNAKTSFFSKLIKREPEKAISNPPADLPKKQKKKLLDRIFGNQKSLEDGQSQPDDLPKSLMKPESAEESMVLPIMAEFGENDHIPSEETINDYHENISEVPTESNDAEDTLPDESFENIPEDQPDPVTQPESDDLNEEATLEGSIEETPQSELHVASNPDFENPELMDNENTGDEWKPEVAEPETVPVMIKQRKQQKKTEVDSGRHKNNDAVESEKLIPRKPSNVVRNKLKMSEAFRLAPRDTTPKYGRSRSDTPEEAEELQRQYYNRNREKQKFRCDCGCDCDCHNEDNNRRKMPVQLPINVTPPYESNGYYPVINGNLQLPNSIPGDVQANIPCSLKLELEFWNDCGRHPR